MFNLASFKWAPLALCAIGVNFVNADTWSSLDNARGAPVKSVAQAPVTSNKATATGLSPAASQLLFSEIEMLKEEIQSLRSTVEEQGYELNKLKTEQKQRYLDLDRRMTQVLQGQSVSEAPAASTSGNGDEEYDAALSLMKQRKLDEAAVKFKSFLQAFPKSELAVNGYYWLGQIYYNQGNLEEARKAFTIVVNQYPDHQKTPDSTYKLGVVLHRLGDTAQSKTLLQLVVNKFSDSASARFASKYLKDNFK